MFRTKGTGHLFVARSQVKVHAMLQNKFGRRNRRYRTIGMEPLESRAMLSVAAISLRTDGVDTGNVGSPFSQQSADGRYVVFRSSATNLVSGVRDVNGFNSDIFRRDRLTGKTELVSVSRLGQNRTPNQPSFNA